MQRRQAFRTFVNRAIRLPMKARFYRVMYNLANIYDYQESFLYDTVLDASNTEYGKKHGFDSIDDIASYQKTVPLSDYESLWPSIEKTMQGEQNILTPYDIIRFAQSAGTTGSANKFLPVTEKSLSENHFKCSRDFLSLYLRNNPYSKLLEGLGVLLVGGVFENPYTHAKNIGYISSILSMEKPRRGSYFTALDESYIHIENWDEKMSHIVKHYSKESITSISGVGPWIVLLGDMLQRQGKKIEDIRPSFELVLSGGVMIDLYKQQYLDVFGKDINIYNMYNSSEGFYGFQIANHDHSLLLATNHAIFYEFIPMDQYQGLDSKTLTLDQVEVGQDYALVITNNAGLRRYILGDTIRFISLNPFKFHVTGRTKFFIDSFSEHVILDNVVKAIELTTKEHPCEVGEYTVGPCFLENSQGCHEWIIEFRSPPTDKEKFITTLDLALQKENSYYASKRKGDVLLQRPILHIAPSGTFNKWFTMKGKLGGQSKVPNLANTRKYLDEILPLL